MSHLLPTPATELATKVELRDLRSEMNDGFDRMFIAQIGGFIALIIAILLN